MRGVLYQCRILEGHGPQDHPRDPGREPVLDHGHVPDAAAELDRKARRRADRPDSFCVCGLACKGAVEVDAMQPLKSGALEGERLRGRIVIEDGGRFHFAALQPHAAPVLQIDSGEKDHGRHSRKLPSKASPMAWLFSG